MMICLSGMSFLNAQDSSVKKQKVRRTTLNNLENGGHSDAIDDKGPMSPINENIPVIYNKADVNPGFVGGFKQFMFYLSETVNFPSDCDNSVHYGDSLTVRLIVTREGKIQNPVQINKGGCTALNQEILRCISRSPSWIPGQVAGKFVSSYLTLKISLMDFMPQGPAPVENITVNRKPVTDLNPSGSDAIKDNDTIYNYPNSYGNVEIPKYPGNLSEFILNEFQYPSRCSEENISGSVVLRFVVEKDGSITDIQVTEKTAACPEFSYEAIRVLKKSGRWKPGSQNGKPVRMYLSLPVRLALN